MDTGLLLSNISDAQDMDVLREALSKFTLTEENICRGSARGKVAKEEIMQCTCQFVPVLLVPPPRPPPRSLQIPFSCAFPLPPHATSTTVLFISIGQASTVLRVHVAMTRSASTGCCISSVRPMIVRVASIAKTKG